MFDASDSMGKVEDEEEIEEPEDDVDLSHLRSEFLFALACTRLINSYIGEFLPDLGVLDDKEISHSLAEFSFSKDTFVFDDTTFFQDNTHTGNDDDDDDDVGGDQGDGGGDHMDVDNNGAPVEDFFVGDQAVGDDYGEDMGMGGGDGDYGGGDDQSNSNGSVGADANHGAANGGGRPGAFVPFDPRRVPNERDFVMAMTDADAGGMMDYFDQNFLKNWAGPEHWKLRKVIRRRASRHHLPSTCFPRFTDPCAF